MTDVVSVTFTNSYDSAKVATQAAVPFYESKDARAFRVAPIWGTLVIITSDVFAAGIT